MSTVAGGAFAAFRPPPSRWRSGIPHFAAGVCAIGVGILIDGFPRGVGFEADGRQPHLN